MNNNDKWLRYCDLLFSDDSLGFWLDISRMNVEKDDFENFKDIYSKAFDSVESLEKARLPILMKVGKSVITGLNPKIAPTQEISDSITKEIQDITNFGASILNGEITNSDGKKYTDVSIGIGGSGLSLTY